MHDESKEVRLYVTKDYDTFKTLTGNRPLDKLHVARLRRKIEKEGNLTSEFPVNVNENLEIVDGQHRVAALQELGYPVYYTVSEGAGLSTVRQVNMARRNWSWQDYANSFAADGNPHYKDLLDFSEAFKFNNTILITYTHAGTKMSVSDFQGGDYKVLDKALSFKLFNQLSEIRDALPFVLTGSLGRAFYDILTHPEYDHKRMVDKLTKYGAQLHEWRIKKDWMRNLEDVYNIGQTESTRVRFF